MSEPLTRALDESMVTPESSEFAAHLFARFPEFRQYAAMESYDKGSHWSLVVTVPSPTGKPESNLVVWMNGGDEPSISLGTWHTHDGLWDADGPSSEPHGDILNTIAGILTERYVLCEATMKGGWSALLDMTREDALLDFMTGNGAPKKARVVSWTGRLDRVVSLDDLSLGQGK